MPNEIKTSEINKLIKHEIDRYVIEYVLKQWKKIIKVTLNTVLFHD